MIAMRLWDLRFSSDSTYRRHRLQKGSWEDPKVFKGQNPDTGSKPPDLGAFKDPISIGRAKGAGLGDPKKGSEGLPQQNSSRLQ